MNRRNILLSAFFFWCFSAFAQESSPISASDSETPSGRLRSIAESLEELEKSETVSLADLMSLKEDLTALEELLSTSEAMLTELQTQADDALERYEKLRQRYEKQQQSLSGWRIGCLGSSALTVILIVLLILL
jgi:septal ring factor EnvC (AmiA/AmiB activator)